MGGKEMENEKNNRPFLEKFMLPPDDYEIFKFGGGSLKDEERGIKYLDISFYCIH